MKNFLNVKSVLGLAVATMLLASCAQSDKVVSNNFIQKRKYNKGFFIDFKKNNKENLAKNEITTKKTKTEERVATTEKTITAPVTASTDDKTEVIVAKKSAIKTAKKPATKTNIEENIVLSKTVERAIRKVNKAIVKQNNKSENTNTPAPAAAGSGKSQIVALILAALVGGLGIHRFYLGYTWQGVVQLLTLGACGIWSLIDLIRIITGDLGPKSGRYDKTL